MSHILTSLIKKRIPQWNEKVFTEEDFYSICIQEKICVIESKIRSNGEYLIHNTVPCIVLKKNLDKSWRSWVAWHELGHYFLHHPGRYHFNYAAARKSDFEANFLASVALIPSYLTKSLTYAELIEEYNYPEKLIVFRKQIYDYYKI